MYRCHIEKVIGELELIEIKRTHIQELISPLSPQTSQMTLAVLKSIFREALAQELVEHSPAHGVKGQQVIVAPRRFLTWEEVNRINFGKYDTQIRFLALHGLRWSEAVVITQEDIRDGFVWVSKSFYGDVKSSASNRKVPYLGFFEPLPKCYKALRKAVNKHGINVHSLRRTYAYLLKTQGVHVTTAQKLLGHSDPMMTLKVYTSVLDSEIDYAGELLKSVI